MGYAKYSEDNIRIRDDNFFIKNKSSKYIKRKLSKKCKTKSNNKSSPKEKLMDIKIRIIQIQVWIDFYNEIREKFESKVLNRYLDFRIEDLEELKEEYYDSYFEPEYKYIREQITVNTSEIQNEFLEIIKDDFIQIIGILFSKMRNRTMADSLELRAFYLDLDYYIEKVLEQNMKKPYIENVIKLALDKDESKIENCSLCKEKTYSSVYICINCDCDKGE